MKKIRLAICLLGSMVASTAMASPCDNRSINISGPEYYQYKINLTKGSIGKKGNKINVIQDQLASPDGTDYDVFTASGSNGDVVGKIYFTNLETKEKLTLPISFISNNGRTVCYVVPALQNVEVGKIQIQAQETDISDLIIKIREFK